MQRELVVGGLGSPRDRQRGLDILRLAGLDRDAGELLAAVSFGEVHLKIARCVGAEIDRRVLAAVVGYRHSILEGGGRGSAQRGEIGGQFQLGGKLLADNKGNRQFVVLLAVLGILGFDREAVFALPDPAGRLQPQLQPLLRIRHNIDRRYRLPAAEYCRFPALRHLGYGQGQHLRRQFEVAQRQIDGSGLAGADGQRGVFRRQE